MERVLSFNVHYRHPPERVWAAITDKTALGTWMLDMQTDFEPILGREFVYRTTPRGDFDGIVRCKVTECVPVERLAYTWKALPVDGMLTFSLASTPTGTRMRMVHSGFHGIPGLIVSLILQFGWWRELHWRLRRYLSQTQNALQPGSSESVTRG